MRRVWLVFGESPAWDGGAHLLSLHDSRAGAHEAADRQRRKRTNRFDRIVVVQRGVSTKKKPRRQEGSA